MENFYVITAGFTGAIQYQCEAESAEDALREFLDDLGGEASEKTYDTSSSDADYYVHRLDSETAGVWPEKIDGEDSFMIHALGRLAVETAGYSEVKDEE